jgi:hypothetical protein
MTSPHTIAAKKVREKDGFSVYEVDTKHSTYFGKKWRDLNSFDKRKFENLLVLSAAPERVKVLYH